MAYDPTTWNTGPYYMEWSVPAREGPLSWDDYHSTRAVNFPTMDEAVGYAADLFRDGHATGKYAFIVFENAVVAHVVGDLCR